MPGKGASDQPELFRVVILLREAPPRSCQDGVNQHVFVDFPGHQHAPDRGVGCGDGPAHLGTGTIRKVVVPDDQVRAQRRDPPDGFTD
ncbi:hypothetical protein D9M72_596040 [compost metagenome]